MAQATGTGVTLGLIAVLATALWYDGARVDRFEGDALAVASTLEAEHPVGAPPAASGPGTLVVDLRDGATDADLAAAAAALGAPLTWVHPEARDEALAWAEVPDLGVAAAALSGLATVEAAEPVVTLSAPMPLADVPERGDASAGWSWPNDPLFPEQWHLRAMGAPFGWSSTPMGAGVVVAVVDTGVSLVEDLGGTEILPGMSFVPGVASAADDNGHGTHVAGTIAQTTHNGLGTAGVAPAARILPVKVLSGVGGGSSAGVAAGIDWAVDHGAQVINLSLGGAYSEVVAIAVRKARAQGVLVVAAAGNDGRLGVSWPAALEEAIGVSATGPDGTLAPYSNFGPGVDLSAPGGDKTRPGGGVLQDTIGPEGHAYRSFQGTSMAAPHVSGAAAVLLSTGVLSPGEVEQVLLAGADGRLWTPSHGWGRLDLEGALTLIGSTGGPARFGLGAVVAFLVAGLSGAGVGFRLLATLVGAASAGGLFFLAPGEGAAVAWLSRGVLAWPVVAFGPFWGQIPAWLGAVGALICAFALGPFRLTRPLAVGVCAGIGAHLVHGLATGSMVPWFATGVVASTWLGLNATVAVLAGMAVAGLDRLDRRREG